MKKWLLSALLLLLTTIGVTRVSADTNKVDAIKKAGVLRVGVKQDVPNFGYLNAETNQFEGMEIDIAKKLAKSLGVKVEYTPVTTQTREPLMDNGQVDIIIATYTITEQRQASFSISDPYYYDQIGFLVRKKSKIQTMDDLDGLTIGVAQGATTKANLKAYAEENGLSFKFVQLGSYPELTMSLQAKRIDAFSVDKSLLSGYVHKGNRMLDDGFNTQAYGIATKKTNTDLTDFINQELTKWRQNGSLQKIYDKFELTPAEPTN
ncbi:transporter substrate-binding domain-containing protein [Streptococcus hillyeri]|uniref:Glutamine ABC transporter substrate-binding protein n=1 Tax=Streptococcus hillyeri TaxID=2282420 RepID=A0A3L9DUQ5_9STRE|nr:transporter substrate-binding domain-containing protein [Streptococcus hillyeri]RLY04765.1 glutamine ABC transporter substrate-binding protein [Streptococcus hillyeri]